MMLAAIEDAMTAALATVFDAPALGYRKPRVEAYSGQLDSDELVNVVRTLPAVWITYGGGGKPARVNAARDRWLTPVTMVTMVATRNVRGEHVARHGVTNSAGAVVEPGVYHLLDAICQVLLGRDLGLAIRPFEPGAVKTVINSRLNSDAWAVYGQEWHTAYTARTPAEAAAELLRIGVDITRPGSAEAVLSPSVVTLRDQP